MARIIRILPLLLGAALLAIPAALATDVSRDQDIAVHIQSNLFGPKKLVFPGGSNVPDKGDLIRDYDSKRLDKAFGDVWGMTNGYAPTNGHATTNGYAVTNGYAPTNGHVATNGQTVTNGMAEPFQDTNRNIKLSYTGGNFREYGFTDTDGDYHVVGWHARNGMEIHLPNQETYSSTELKYFIERIDVLWEEHTVDPHRLNLFMKKTF